MYRISLSKKVRSIFVGIIFFSSFATSAISGPVTSTFDTGTDGWTWDSGLNAAFTWESSGGNPGGYIRYDDNKDTGPVSGIYAPADYLGDWQTPDITYLTYETKVFSTGSIASFGHYQVWISGPGGSAKWIGPNPPASAGDWLLIEVPITESQWIVESGSWGDLLPNITELYIHMEYYSNWTSFEIVGIDNINLNETPGVVVPVPAAVLLGILGLGFAGIKLRKFV